MKQCFKLVIYIKFWLPFCYVFFIPINIAITSLGEERAGLCAFRALSFARVLVCVSFLFSLCQGLAATCDCDTLGLFVLPFSKLIFEKYEGY